MNPKKELKKTAKQTFPTCQYSFRECRKHRKNLYNDMLSYWCSHPEQSLEDIKYLFCDEDEDTNIKKECSTKTNIYYVILGTIIIICIALFFFSHSWDAPTFYY